ncbi:hypothetical protein CYV19_16350 [Natronobacterium gregoryi SP2]|uniref:Uncharacterized protein n=1 Tax=Natronobacterium gregoryi (strain ATCC 43098 / DSM 3393 / CCM 3738 / CIP 104747 / IAM 13177 / JCM 8860 / NBRC 102187 / NCIMB 2189 / SP2) TaxID=797304 RepID=A0A2J4JBB3_NATGS|nr:hypothetical protein CYV19_16350 [Natronobacterium gregoryi SP2]
MLARCLGVAASGQGTDGGESAPAPPSRKPFELRPERSPVTRQLPSRRPVILVPSQPSTDGSNRATPPDSTHQCRLGPPLEPSCETDCCTDVPAAAAGGLAVAPDMTDSKPDETARSPRPHVP